jgi:hypothetical protein
MIATDSLLKYDSRKHEEGKEDMWLWIKNLLAVKTTTYYITEHNKSFSGSACVKPCIVDIAE